VIRRLAESLVGEDALRELRETMFPQPPERSEPRPAGAPLPAPRSWPPARAVATVDVEERDPESEGRRSRAGQPAIAAPGTRSTARAAATRQLFRNPALLRQAILAREILGPPKGLQ
jgi:hypothetical protein